MRKKYWTEDKIQFIKDNVCTMTEFQLAKHFNCLIKQDKDECIQNAVVIKNGEIIDNRIRDFRKKHCKLEQEKENWEVKKQF